jgi:SAM-dependent methyltransferase
MRPGANIADFRVGDAQDLPFADASFDVAVMALVISFLPNPAKAVWQMARVVRSGGWVATYMWDIPGGGTPVDPIYVEMESMGMTAVRPSNSAASRREAMQELWRNAGLDSIETYVIRIPVLFSDFNDFWNSNAAPIGPQGKLIDGMSGRKRGTSHTTASPTTHRLGWADCLRILRQCCERTGALATSSKHAPTSGIDAVDGSSTGT